MLSSRPLDIPRHLASSVQWMSGSPAELVHRLRQWGARHLYVDGGKTIQEFLDAGLLQQLIITRVPVLIGGGISLFGPLRQDIRLRHLETRSFASGLVQSRYEVVAPGPESDAPQNP